MNEGARRRSVRFLLPALWITLTVALAVVLPRLPWRRTIDLVTQATPTWLILAALLNLAILPLWALEWRLLVPRAFMVPFPRMFGIVAVTASVLNSVPMLAGEVSAIALLVSRAGLSRGAALSVLAMDQLLVAFAKILVLVAAALSAPLPAGLRTGLLSLTGALVFALIALLLLAHRWEAIGDRLRQGDSAARRMAARAISWGAQLDALRSLRIVAMAATLAAAKKTLEVLAVLATQLAFGLEPSAPIAILVVAALAIATLVPVAPANLGVYEATVFAVYRFTGSSAESALGLALVQHLCFLIPSLATGYVILTARQLVPRLRQAA